jgi:hypothetical protein
MSMRQLTAFQLNIPWRGGRVVDCDALEMRFGGNFDGGSNPPLSVVLVSRVRQQLYGQLDAVNKSLLSNLHLPALR